MIKYAKNSKILILLITKYFLYKNVLQINNNTIGSILNQF